MRTALATETSNLFAAARTLSPCARAAATRIRKSKDKGFTIAAGLLSSSKGEAHPARFGNPKSIPTIADKL
jgi:hypothetical protein